MGANAGWPAHKNEEESKEIGYVLNPKYRFQKTEALKLLDNKEVITLYYNIFKFEYLD